MANKQYYGIKYPFRSDEYEKFFVDANSDLLEKVKGQRLRMPQFGTDLIKYIFEQNENTTWESVKREISDAVKRWIPNCSLNNVEVVSNVNNENEIYVKLTYSVQDGNMVIEDSVVVEV